MTIYEKLSNARISFHANPMEKSGHNKFANYKYFELADFVKPAMKSLHDNGLVAFASFDRDIATLTVREFVGDGEIKITCPFVEIEMKGANKVQALGAVQTYTRRYLWTALMDIIETDGIDCQEQVRQEPKTKQNLLAMAAKDGISPSVLEKYMVGKTEDGVIANYSKAIISLKKLQQEDDQIPF